MSGKAPVVTGNAHPNIYPYDVFRSGTKPIFLAIGNNGQFRRLCAAIGASELSDDPRYADNGLRSTNRVPLKASIEAKLRSEENTSELQSLMRNSYADFC